MEENNASFLNDFVINYDNGNPVFNPESDDGYIEYKLRLDHIDPKRLTQMVSQMRYRVQEGYLETGRHNAYYFIGVDDSGLTGYITKEVLDKSLIILDEIAKRNNFIIKHCDKYIFNNKWFAIALITKKNINKINELRTIFLGPSYHGKTTTISVLTYGEKDNGNGSGRSSVFKHTHECTTGLTSSIKHDIIGLDSINNLNNYRSSAFCTWDRIVESSNKIISLIDLPGLIKYFRTTIYGILSNKPDVFVIVIDINSELNQDVILFIKLALCIKIKFIILFTKSDMLVDKEPKIQKNLYIDSLYNMFPHFKTYYIDSFVISNTTLQYHNEFIVALNKITVNDISLKYEQNPNNTNNADFMINNVFGNSGNTGNIVSGIMTSGVIEIGNKLKIGPYYGEFYDVIVKTIYKKQISSNCITNGEMGSLELQLDDNIEIDKHMSLISQSIYEKLKSVNDHFVVKLDHLSEQPFLEDSDCQLRIGHQYMLFVGNVIEPVLIISKTYVPEDKDEDTYCLSLRFSKYGNKNNSYSKNNLIHIRNDDKCLLKCDNKNEMYFSGKIL